MISVPLTPFYSGAVTSVPETTFNNMHGKIVDLNTEDARQFAVNQLNEIGECFSVPVCPP